jgi:hypothetical protein
MNIPITGAATPVTGITPTPRRYIPRALSPQRMWHVIRAVASIRNQVSPDEVARQIVPRGFPGAGVFHGNTNVAKSVTYRATYVPGGFNVVRDQYRRLRASALLKDSLEGVRSPASGEAK